MTTRRKNLVKLLLSCAASISMSVSVRAQFDYSADDVADNLVVIRCTSKV